MGRAVLGIWWFLLGDSKQVLRDAEVTISFEGEPLDLNESGITRIVDPQNFFGFDEFGAEWWMSVGVPVFGTLDPGEHLVESTYQFPDDLLVEDYALLAILDC